MKHKLMTILLSFAAGTAFAEWPDWATPVEYIESTGVQSLSTGFKPTDATVIELDMMLLQTSQQAIFAAGGWSNNRFMLVTMNNSNNPRFLFYGTGGWVASAAVSNRYAITVGDGVAKVKNLTAGGGSVSSQTTSGYNDSIWLFAAGKNSWCSRYCLYSCRLTDNGTLVRDFVPCVSNYNGDTSLAGLYDRVNDQFYPRADTAKAEFTVGPAVDFSAMLEVRCSSDLIEPALSPSGTVTGLEEGDTRTLTAPAAATDQLGNSYTCTGCRVYDAVYDATTGEMVPGTEIAGSPFTGTSFTYTHGTTMRLAVWQYARTATVDPDDFDHAVEFTAPKVTQGIDETEFKGCPVLVRLTDDPALFSYAKLSDPDGGADIAFFAPDGTPLPHEIDNWDKSGTSTVWVKIPELKTGAKFRMCFGCADAAKRAPQRPSVVWAGYQGVWHLNEMAETGGHVESADSTGNGLAARVNDATVTPEMNAGVVGKSYLGRTTANDMASGLTVPNSAALLDLSSFTLTGWLRRPAGDFTSDSQTAFSSKTYKTAAGGGFAPVKGNMDIEYQLYTTGSANTQIYFDRLMDITFKDWTYFTLSYVSNSATAGTFTFNLNGGSYSKSVTRDYAVSGNDLGLAAFAGATTGWRGPVDEFRWIKKALSSQRIAADYAMMKNADYFDVQGVAHGADGTLTVTKVIPDLSLDLDLPECHQTYVSATNYVFTCSATRDRFYTKDDVAYECTGYVFTPEGGLDPTVGHATSFTFEPATMSGGTLEWQFAEAGYRARVHQVPPYLAEMATVTVTPDESSNHLFDDFYKQGTELTVTLTELAPGVFTRWYGPAASVVSNKTVTYTVAASGNNPAFAPEVLGIVSTDDDTRLKTDNCARVPKTRYLYLAADGSDTNDALTAATPVATIAKAVEIARAGSAADGAQQVVLVGPGTYSGYGIRTVPITEPIVFDGGTNNPAFSGNTSITGAYLYQLAGDRAAFRRLTVKVTGTSTGSKAAGIVSVSAGACESVVMTNLCTGTEYNAADGCIALSGSGVITNCLITKCHSDCPTVVKTTLGIVKMSGGLLAHTRITGCAVYGTASGYGGGVYMTGGTIRNCLIDHCAAQMEGSGLYVPAGAACAIENCTVVDCGPASTSSADLYGVYLVGAKNKAISFVNNIVWGNSGASSAKKDIMNLSWNSATYVSLYNNLTDAAIAESETASGNVAGNPSFTDRAGGDYTIGRGLARNAGLDRAWALAADACDLAGKARVQEERIDIGCYEYVPSAALAATVTVTTPEGFKYGDEATLSCEASGGAGGYTYAWYFGDTLVASGPDATTNVAVRTMGVIDVKCVVTDAAAATVTAVQEGAIRLFVSKVYVATTGKHVSPFDSWENAATNFEDSLVLLDATKACEVAVGPGVYALAKEISLSQKTSFVSTDGAAATVLRPQPGVSAFSVVGSGSVIEGFTVEGMSGAARGLNAGTTLYMTNVCFRNCDVSLNGFFWSPNTARVNSYNLTLNCVTNLGGSLFVGEEGQVVDTHRNLRVTDCRASTYGVYAVRHGCNIYNGLFLRVKTGSYLGYSQCQDATLRLYSSTVDDCVCSGGFYSNSGGSDKYYFYNTIIGRLWTSDAKTTRSIAMCNTGDYCYACCLPAENPGSGTWDAKTVTTDAKLKRGGYLKSNSPCLRAGEPSYCTANGIATDLDGRERFHTDTGATTVDMGCFENPIHGLLLLVK